MVCLIFRSTDQAGIKAISLVGEEFDMSAMKNGPALGYSSSFGNEELLTPLDTDWGIREWIGLGVGAFTTLSSLLLTTAAAQLQHRHAQKNLWGLTEQGVGKLLQLGWAYEQENTTGQLFLKVYNKEGHGYDDQNSILHGEVVEELAMAGTATTATPGSQQSPDNAV